MRDLIEIQDLKGNKRFVELVLKFDIEGYDYNYIIYRELDYSHTYVARYVGDEIVNLDTNLSDFEFSMARKFLEGVQNSEK